MDRHYLYLQWIERMLKERYRGEPHRTLGRCRQEASAMQADFPELTIVKGHVILFAPEGMTRRSHWWLTTPEGEIVDPTRGQFPYAIYRYKPYAPGDPVRLGACINCGATIYGRLGDSSPATCSDACTEEFDKFTRD